MLAALKRRGLEATEEGDIRGAIVGTCTSGDGYCLPFSRFRARWPGDEVVSAPPCDHVCGARGRGTKKNEREAASKGVRLAARKRPNAPLVPTRRHEESATQPVRSAAKAVDPGGEGAEGAARRQERAALSLAHRRCRWRKATPSSFKLAADGCVSSTSP